MPADDRTGGGPVAPRRALPLALESPAHPTTEARPPTPTPTTPTEVVGLLAAAARQRSLLQRLPSSEIVNVQQLLGDLMAETVAALKRATPP